MRPSLSSLLLVAVVVAVLCLLAPHPAAARPYSGAAGNALGGKDRQELAKYAAKMLQILLHQEGAAGQHQTGDKRNSGMLDAVINMPDLFGAGKR